MIYVLSRKVNDNFQELDPMEPGSTASNLGAVGEGVFAQKEGNHHNLKR